MVAPKYGFKGPWDAMNRRRKRHGITCELPNNCVMECFIARAKDLTVTVPAHTRHGNGHVEDVDYKRTYPADKQMYMSTVTTKL